MGPSDYLTDPDVQAMLAFQQGDKRAFEQLMIKYFPRVLNFIFRYVGDRSLAEDLTQEVFIKVYKSAPHYQVKSKLSTWIFTIAKNISLNELRKHRVRIQSLDATHDTGEGHVQVQLADANQLDPAEQILKSEKNKLIRQAILDLPENQKTAVLLRRYEQFSYDQIAQVMKTTPKAVKSLLNRAKENLRISLQKLWKNG